MLAGVISDLAARTRDCASTALRSSATSCLPEIVQLLRTFAIDPIKLSLEELTELIQKDTAILTKIVAAANTLGYNPSKVPIDTLSLAIQVIGFERIRRLAISLLLMQEASTPGEAEEPAEAAALALTAGSIGQIAAQIRGRREVEEVFVCAALRHFGRMVLTSFMLEDYRRAMQLAEMYDENEAFVRVFGLTPPEVGYDLLKTCGIPESVLATLRPAAAADKGDTAQDPELLGLAEFAAALAELILSPDLTANVFTEHTRLLAQRWHELLPGLEKEIPLIVKRADQHVNYFARSFSIQSLPLCSLRRLRERAEGIDPPESLQEPAARLARAVVDSSSSSPPLEASAWENTIERTVAEISQVKGPIPPAALLERSLGLLQLGLNASDCLLFRAVGPEGVFVVHHGRGGWHAHNRSQIHARSTERTVLGICLSRQENVLIHDSTDPKILPYLPAWLREPGAPQAFALFPLVEQSRAVGIILVGWSTPRPITISPDRSQIIRKLLSALGRVLSATARPTRAVLGHPVG